jgi:hypothetical protein
MRILFFAKKSRLRPFADVVRLLAAQGHIVVLAEANESARANETPKLPKLLRRVSGVESLYYAPSSDPERAYALDLLRSAHNYLWFFEEPQAESGFHRMRFARRLSKLIDHRPAARGAQGGSAPWPDPLRNVQPVTIERLRRGFAALEAAIPAERSVVGVIRAQRPDVVLVTPLMLFGAPQTDVVKAAHELGIPCGFLVYSWDNLTNKGTLQVMPDRIFVWNEVQRQEAISMHGVQPDRVVATGAPRLDGFFEMQHSQDRHEFCREHGFDPVKPIILYVASSATVSLYEPRITQRWIDAVRAAPDPRVRDASILVRTYPASAAHRAWQDWHPHGAAVGVDRCESPGYQGLYDDLHHAAVVVGLNTSAQVEAAVLEKPVYAFAGGDEAPGQEQTLNFHYMLREHGGHVEFASTLEKHVAQLARGLAGDYDKAAIRRFAKTFLRPHGLDRPVAPILAAEIVALAGRRSLRRRADDAMHATAASIRHRALPGSRRVRRIGARTLRRIYRPDSAPS